MSALLPMFVAGLVVMGVGMAVFVRGPSMMVGFLFSRTGVFLLLAFAFAWSVGWVQMATLQSLFVWFVQAMVHLLNALFHSTLSAASGVGTAGG